VHKSKEKDGSNNYVTVNTKDNDLSECQMYYNLQDHAHLHVDKLDSSTVTRRDNMEDIHTPAVAVPRGAILKDLRDLWSSLLGHVC
jgi:hypothetical protein